MSWDELIFVFLCLKHFQEVYLISHKKFTVYFETKWPEILNSVSSFHTNNDNNDIVLFWGSIFYWDVRRFFFSNCYFFVAVLCRLRGIINFQRFLWCRFVFLWRLYGSHYVFNTSFGWILFIRVTKPIVNFHHKPDVIKFCVKRFTTNYNN